MAENPVVDGITNLAIPNAPCGVYMANHVVPGSLFGINTVVSGNAGLSGMNVSGDACLGGMNVSGDAYLSGMNVSGNAYLSGMNVSGDAYLSGMNVSGDAYLSGMNVSGDADLSGIRYTTLHLRRGKPLEIRGTLDLSGASIDHLIVSEDGEEKPLIVGSYKLNDKTNIPDALMELLKQYQKV
ncbi:MAG: hypothetical protein AABX82_01515 [Nanoarchaeota archaeon]